MDNSSREMTMLQNQAEKMMRDALHLTEMAMDLKERSTSGEKHIRYLQSLAVRFNVQVTTMGNTSDRFFLVAQKLCESATIKMDSILECDPSFVNIKQQFEKLLTILDNEVKKSSNSNDDFETTDVLSAQDLNFVQEKSVVDKIKELEAKQTALSETDLVRPSSSCSLKSYKYDTDEKYPESLSRDSLLDINTIVNLPTLPEDIFTCCSNKPVRSISLCSLKSLRKLKLSLQRANFSCDQTVDPDECDYYIYEDPSTSKNKKCTKLSFITEEAQE